MKMLYDEEISMGIAKAILGSRFPQRPAVRYVLTTETSATTLTVWYEDGGADEFELESDDEVESYDEMMNVINNGTHEFVPMPERTENDAKHDKSPLRVAMLCVVACLFTAGLILFAFMFYVQWRLQNGF